MGNWTDENGLPDLDEDEVENSEDATDGDIPDEDDLDSSLE